MDFQTEETDVGEQSLMTGVQPITFADRLQAMTEQPMRPKRNPFVQQKPADLGLFDEVGRAQMDFADLLFQPEEQTT